MRVNSSLDRLFMIYRVFFFLSPEYDRNQPLECCGDHIYNTNKKVCCASSSNIKTPKHKERSDHNACCRWTQTSYNDITHECTDKGIEEKKKKKKMKKKKKKETDTRPCPFCTDWLPIGLCTRKKSKPTLLF